MILSFKQSPSQILHYDCHHHQKTNHSTHQTQMPSPSSQKITHYSTKRKNQSALNDHQHPHNQSMVIQSLPRLFINSLHHSLDVTLISILTINQSVSEILLYEHYNHQENSPSLTHLSTISPLDGSIKHTYPPSPLTKSRILTINHSVRILSRRCHNHAPPPKSVLCHGHLRRPTYVLDTIQD